MIDRKKFEASDDDLPDAFFSDWPLTRVITPADAEEVAKIAVQVHYPSAKETKRDQLRERRNISAEVRAVANEKPRYIKGAKRRIMFQWCLALEHMVHVLEPREADLVNYLLSKFRRYGHRAKWVSQKQYEFLLDVASKNLDLPGFKRGR